MEVKILTPNKKAQIAELQRRVDHMDEVVFQLTVLMRAGGEPINHCVDAAQAIRNAMARALNRVREAA